MIGHIEQQSTVPIGAYARMNADAGKLALTAPSVR
jgi:muramoyltetrapeptide carboxypeptidase LdcA involved in peptidoglycan recycling